MVLNYINPPLIKLSKTISQSSMAKQEYENTKIPRLLREAKMQDIITKQLGFNESNRPLFLKNKDPKLKGTNAYYLPGKHEIHYDAGEWTPGVLAHEIGHSTMGIDPLSKAMNIGSSLAAMSTLPLAIAADSTTVNKLSPTLLEGLKASGGLKNKAKLLKAGLKGRGAKWAIGSALLAGAGTLAEEARASLLGAKGIDSLEDEGILSKEQSDLAKNTMRNAYLSYLVGVPISITSDAAIKNIISRVVPKKAKLPLATGLASLGALGVAKGYGYLDAYNPVSNLSNKYIHSMLGDRDE